MIDVKLIRNPFKEVDVKKALEEAEREIEDPNTKFISHEELFESARRLLDGRY